MTAAVVTGLCAGMAVVVPRPVVVHAVAPTPGIITTFAGGGLGTGLAAQIGQTPFGLAVHGSTLYVADQYHDVVRAVDLTTSVATVVAGNGVAGNTGDAGPATAAELEIPYGVAVDSGGNLYIATQTTYLNDPANRIRRVDSGTGVITTVAGGGASYADGVAATSTVISGVDGLAMNAAGDLLFADDANNRIRMVNHTTGIVTTVVGTGNITYNGDGIPATSANIYAPFDVAVDSAGNLWIAEYGGPRIREVDHSTGLISTVVGNGSIDTSGVCPTGSPTGAIAWPYGVSLDTITGNPIFPEANCVTELIGGALVNIAGDGIDVLGGDGGPATSAGVGVPVRAVMDSLGNLYIAQQAFHLVRRVDHSTHVITTFAGNQGTCGWAGDGGPATAASMCTPDALAIGPGGDLFVADGSRNVVRKISTGGVITLVAGNGTQGYSGDNGPATSAELNGPSGLAVDSAGDVFIADILNRRVRKVDSSGTITTVAGDGVDGYTGDGGPATSAELSYPTGLAVDAAGDLFIADYGYIREVNTLGIITTRTTLPFLTQSQQLAFDAGGNLFAAGQDGVFSMSPGGSVTSLGFAYAQGIAIGPQGQIVISFPSRVEELTPNGLVPLAGTGSSGSSGDGGPALAAMLAYNNAVAVDSAGDIFISDMGNNRIRRVQAYTTPGAPTSVHASLTGLSATVSWAAPADTGGAPIVDYVVTSHVGSITTSIAVTGDPAATTTAFGNLHNFATYTFTVSASNGWATGADSAPSTGITALLADGIMATYAGTPAEGPASGIGQTPVSLALELPQIFVADAANPVIRTLDTGTGQETILAGNDSYGASGDGGPPLSASMQGAGAVTECGPAGPVYIADTANFRIRVVNGSTISNFAGTGVQGDSGDGGPATQAQIGSVYGLACGFGNTVLLFTDATYGVVRAVDVYGNITTLWAGLGEAAGIVAVDSNVTFVSDIYYNRVWYLNSLYGVCVAAGIPPAGYACDTGNAEQVGLNVPRGISWDGTNLYIADSYSNLITKVDPLGHETNLVGTGLPGFSGDGGPSGLAKLNYPTAVVFSGNTNSLYIADALNNRVRVVDLSSGVINTIAGNGAPSLAGDSGLASSAQLGLPYAVAEDTAGNEYVVDNLDNAIRKIDTNGVITTVAGYPTVPSSPYGLNDPRGIAVDASGNVYVSDTGHNVVRRVDHLTGLVTTYAGSGVAGYGGDGGPATNSAVKLSVPRGLAFDASGDLFIADTGNNRVREVSTAGTITTVAGDGIAGFAGDSGLAVSAELSGPRGITFNSAGDMFIGDSNNNRVRKVDHTTLHITTVAGTGVIGAGGDGGPAALAELNFPFGMAFDGAGNLFIADSGNNRIRMIDPSGKISTAVGICGSIPAFSGDGGPASIAQLDFPYGVMVDHSGNMVISDTSNNRIRIAHILTTGRQPTCSSPAGTPGSRGTYPGSASNPGPRQSDFGAPPAPGTTVQAPPNRRSGIPTRPGSTVSSHAPIAQPIANSGGTKPARVNPIGTRLRTHGPIMAPAMHSTAVAPSRPNPSGAYTLMAALGAASIVFVCAYLRRRGRKRSRN